jgi:hypothetical protein
MRPGDVRCPVCGDGPFPCSYNGWTQHEGGAYHRLFLLGVPPDEIGSVIQAIADAGVPFEAAMAAIRDALRMPPEQLRAAAERLREFADASVR